MYPKLFYFKILLILSYQNILLGQVDCFLKVDSIIKQRMIENRILGLSIGIVKNGEIFYCKGYGYTNLDSIYPVASDTRFVTGSITKLFTVTAIMQLVEQGKLDLNKKLIDYIPDFQLRGNRYREITLFHLITHTSGLPWDNYLAKSENDSTSLKQFIYSLKNAKLNFKPGEKFSGQTYSNTGYDILGYLIEKITHISFDKYVELNILNKTGMKNSAFSYTKIPTNKFALPHKLAGNTKEINRFNLYGEIKDKNPILKYPELNIIEWKNYQIDKPEHHPSGWLYSTAYDLSNWMLHNLTVFNDSLNYENHFLNNSTLKEMWTSQKKIENKKTSIGLGWWKYDDTVKGNYVFHVGRIPGYSSTLMIFPDKNIGIAILCNGMYADQIIWNSLPFEVLKIIND